MLIRNVQDHDLYTALAVANQQFAGNIVFKRRDYAGGTRQHTNKYTVTLTVRNSHAPGARLSPPYPWNGGKQRHISAACWHAHRAFLDALPPGATVTGGRDTTVTWHPGDPHRDWNVGSYAYPCKASNACNC